MFSQVFSEALYNLWRFLTWLIFLAPEVYNLLHSQTSESIQTMEHYIICHHIQHSFGGKLNITFFYLIILMVLLQPFLFGSVWGFSSPYSYSHCEKHNVTHSIR